MKTKATPSGLKVPPKAYWLHPNQKKYMPKKKNKWDSGSVGRRWHWHPKCYAKYWKYYGLNVAEGGNDQIALDEAKKQSPEVIFLDLMILVMGGLKFLEELIKSPEGRAISIMVINPKEINHADRLLLNGGIEKLIQKKCLDQNGFLKEVRDMLKSCPSWFSSKKIPT